MSTESTSPQGTQALERCFALLRALQDGPATARQLAETTGLARSTAIRMLTALETQGFVVADPSLRYRFGFRIPEMFAAWSAQRPNYAAITEPYLKDLTARTGETSCFVVREGDGSVCLAEVQCGRSTRFSLGIGKRFPGLGAGALHKAVLAYSETSMIDAYTGPAPHGRDPESARRLAADLARIRLTGHAVSRSERDEGEVAVAAPVFGPAEHAIGAIGVGMPEQRFQEEFLDDIAADVRKAAAAVSAELGSGTRG